MRKYIEILENNEYEILTDDGFVDIKSISITIPYIIWILKTENFELKCADTHIVFDENMNEIFVKDLKNDYLIQTSRGTEKVINIIETDVEENMIDIELSNLSKRRFFVNDILSHNSTILRYICGLQKPTSGDIYLHGSKLKSDNHIPMVFQQYSSFPWKTVLDNVALPLILNKVPLKQAREQAMEMIKIVGLEGHESKWAKYPILSGGQLQRVAIARNLVANPNFLLMDEPFGALDTVTRRSMQLFLRKIFQDNNGLDPTILLVTHDVREAVFLSSDIFILDANPAKVRCHIEIDLPNERKNSLKREDKFLEYVNYIDDFSDKLEAEKK